MPLTGARKAGTVAVDVSGFAVKVKVAPVTF
jgi:hypothetical protein